MKIVTFVKPTPCVIAIAAILRVSRAIGNKGELLIKCSEDMNFFSKTTKEGRDPVIISGRKSWFSIPKKWRPLKGRTNFVISRKQWLEIMGNYAEHSVYGFDDPQKALDFAKLYHDKIYITGGQEIYEALLSQCDFLMLTEIDTELEADTFFPEFKSQFDFVKEIQQGFCDDGETRYTINLYRNRKHHGEGEE